MLLSPGRCPGLGAFWAFSPLQPTRRSPRSVVSCCLPCRGLVTRVACVCPLRSCSISWHSFSPWHNLSKLSSAHGLPKELFIVVNVVFVVFPPLQGVKGEGEMARVVPIVWRISFSRRRGRVARGKPWGFALLSYAGRVAGSAVFREAVRPADPPRGV